MEETSVVWLTTPEKIAVYLALGLCGLAIIALALHVQRRFTGASRRLAALNREWADAQASFLGIADAAREKLETGGFRSGAAPARKPPRAQRDPSPEISADLRREVGSMGQRGMTAAEIAHATGLTEAEVDVLMGLSRLTAGQKAARQAESSPAGA